MAVAAATAAFDPGTSGLQSGDKIPLTPAAESLQNFTARILAQNALEVPPSFAEFLASGGQSKFGAIKTQLTPEEAVQLQLVGKTGPIPFFDVGQTALTPEQAASAGSERLAKGTFRKRVRNFEKRERKIEKKEVKLASGDFNERREGKINKRLAELQERQATLSKRLGLA
jgi:hypothetical protein